MKSKTDNNFYSKLLLFGEYSLMLGSMALSIPFTQFSGSFVFDPGFRSVEGGKQSNNDLDRYAGFLQDFMKRQKSGFAIDVVRFTKDIQEGLTFNSNIPREYGLGSSGALVAAIYSKYGSPLINDFSNKKHLLSLKEFLAEMESCFHGKSSGLDPLIGFLKHPVMVDSNGNIELPDLPEFSKGKPAALFLLDSGYSSETQPLVSLFIKKCEDELYLRKINNEYIPLVNTCINAYCGANSKDLDSNMKLLSGFQLKYFSQMVAENMRNAWLKGFESGNYFLKLCGSGGGGMVLGFTMDFERTKNELTDFKPRLVHYI